LDVDISLRIIYLIRSIINTHKQSQILLLFPENKYLIKIYQEIKDSSDFIQLSRSTKIETNIFTASNSSKTSKTLESILRSDFDSTNIIFGTRSSIFLPFTNLSNVIVVDETNLMYIQDQNNLYYDSREAVFILCSILQCDITFISQLPSIRLLEMYSNDSFEELISGYIKNNKKLPKIKISKRNRKADQFLEFSDHIQEMIQPNEKCDD
jgi:primosomal protein N'